MVRGVGGCGRSIRRCRKREHLCKRSEADNGASLVSARLPRRRFVLFATAAMGLAVVGTTGCLFAVDAYLHYRAERSGGVNMWGYRGPALGEKARAEFRIAVLGGSSVYGYGVLWNEAFPHVLEQELNARAPGGGATYRVANLGYPNEAAYSFQFTMDDYEHLASDMFILYEGYNDLGDEPRYQVFRRDSPIFRATGYLPIFPMVFQEKAFALRHGGDIAQGYRERLKLTGPPTVFRPSMAAQVGAAALQTAATTAMTLEEQIGRLTQDPTVVEAATPTTGCVDRWRHYCGAQLAAITKARRKGRAVLVVSQPYASDRHIEQQRALTGLLTARFASDRGVALANLGTVVSLDDPKLSFDHMHLTPEGNRLIAKALVEPVLALARRTAP